MKIFFWVLGGLLIPLSLYLITIGIYNLWPRNIEPDLWPASDYNNTLEDPTKNGWGLLPVRGEKFPFDESGLDLPDELAIIFYRFSSEDPEAFWNEVQEQGSFLTNYVKNHSEILNFYQKILEAPQFIDNDEVGLGKPQHMSIQFIDMHKVMMGSILERAVHNDWQKADELWLKVFKQDREWARTARSMLSNYAAIGMLKNDLDLLALMRYHHPANSWNLMITNLKELNTESLNLHRGLVWEYHQELSFIDQIIPEELQRRNPYLRWIYNPALTKRYLNEKFHELDQLSNDPSIITEEYMAHEAKMSLSEKHSWIRKVINPVGNALNQLMGYTMPEHIKQFYKTKDEIKEIIAQRLEPLAMGQPKIESESKQ